MVFKKPIEELEVFEFQCHPERTGAAPTSATNDL
jgi:hypothetical protein